MTDPKEAQDTNATLGELTEDELTDVSGGSLLNLFIPPTVT